jgi:hypothetical protein
MLTYAITNARAKVLHIRISLPGSFAPSLSQHADFS